jgi:hypothetical protein
MSSPANYSTEEMERLDEQRNRSLMWFLGTFLAWSFASILIIMAAFTLMGTSDSDMILVMSLPLVVLPLLLWIYFLVRFLLIRRRIRRNPEAAAYLDDEMVRDAWRRAAATGFWAMLAVEALVTLQALTLRVIIVTGLVSPIPSVLSAIQAPMVIAVGVGVTIGRYLYLRRG